MKDKSKKIKSIVENIFDDIEKAIFEQHEHHVKHDIRSDYPVLDDEVNTIRPILDSLNFEKYIKKLRNKYLK